jgi:peptidyl-prolyl cis-trans isomerase SurA
MVVAVVSDARAQQIVALVNGQPITALDVEYRSKFMQLSTKKVPPRKEVIDSLIDEILEVNEAKRFTLEVPDADVDNAFNRIATNMGLDAQKFAQVLASSGTNADTLKRRLRAQIAWTSLVRGRFKASLEIRDSDVEAQLQLHKPDEKDQVGYEYIMNPVVFIVPRGSPETAIEARKQDAEA